MLINNSCPILTTYIESGTLSSVLTKTYIIIFILQVDKKPSVREDGIFSISQLDL